METYSVLMSVYKGENPIFFEQAIRSMLEQTVQTNDFVIVCDGPLTAELDAVLEGVAEEYAEIMNIVRLPENVGIGAATDAGLRQCKNNLVAKMDADDIAVPDRCRRQLERFAENPELTVIGGIIEEFDEDPEKPFAVRDVPVSNEEIRSFARRRQPFNNGTVMYKRDAVIAVGGYRRLHRNEDYELYIRMLAAGYYCENLSETLVLYRCNRGAQYRRASWKTLVGCFQSRWHALRIGYCSVFDFLFCVCGQMFMFACPGRVQSWLYARFLRKECSKEGVGSRNE